jgi:hypothetical protein
VDVVGTVACLSGIADPGVYLCIIEKPACGLDRRGMSKIGVRGYRDEQSWRGRKIERACVRA